MIIYIDENMSPFLARGFDILQKPLNIRFNSNIEVRSIKDDFGQGAQDEDWIPEAGKKGACVITQGYKINRIRHQQELCNKYNLGMFYFKPPSKSGFNYWDMVALIVKHWLDIINAAIEHNRPFAYKVTMRGKLEKL